MEVRRGEGCVCVWEKVVDGSHHAFGATYGGFWWRIRQFARELAGNGISI